MNADMLLSYYEEIADAPNAVARLREFILDLAVRGKLVPQDPSDEPASELLKRIATEKARMVKAGLSQKSILEHIAPKEMPFSAPSEWVWTRLENICSKTGSGSTPRGGKEVYQKSGIIFLRSQNVYDDGLWLNDVAYIDEKAHRQMAGTVVKPRDLLLNITGGSIGRCCRVPEDFGEANVSQHVAIIRLVFSEMSEYVHRLILSPYFQSFIFDEQTGAGRGGLPKNRMDRIPVALPPLAEQRRIVARVDELMALCDRLEQARAEREDQRDRLAAATLARLSQPADEPRAFREHVTFALEQLAALTARPDQVKALRQTILDLAVRGKLVPQDPSDEPASELLKRLAAKRARLVKAGEIRKEKPLQEIEPDEIPFELPSGWMWERLGNIGETNIGLTYSPQDLSEVGIPVLRSSNIQNGKLDFSDLVRVRLQPKESVMVQEGDLLICARNGSRALVGKVAVIEGLNEPSAFGAFMAVFRSIANRYLYYFICSPLFRQVIDEVNTTTINQITQNNLRSTIAPLPPLAEQRRIVAKVDELMALCDRLEASLAAGDGARRRLLDAVLHAALEPAAVVGVGQVDAGMLRQARLELE